MKVIKPSLVVAAEFGTTSATIILTNGSSLELRGSEADIASTATAFAAGTDPYTLPASIAISYGKTNP